jgi:hypothetical protein
MADAWEFRVLTAVKRYRSVGGLCEQLKVQKRWQEGKVE